jgi:hypothetical protein
MKTQARWINGIVLFFTMIILFAGRPILAQEKWSLDIETGLVFSGYNNVGIPGDSGTRFSLSKDLDPKSSLFGRLRIGYQLGARHNISLFVAPLRLEAKGSINKTIHFFGEEFSPGVPLRAGYRFNSYRLTYRFDLIRSDRWTVGLGLTAKIRDAAISLEGGGQKVEKKNVGFVPLIHFRVEWRFGPKLGLLLDGDALAAPQGRAEDVLFGLEYQANKNLILKAGFRFIEGGADNKTVYNFALINFLVIGGIFRF